MLATFAVCWLPFIHNTELVLAVVHRLFPFARGLYEVIICTKIGCDNCFYTCKKMEIILMIKHFRFQDKVANVWCSLSIVFKFKEMFSATVLLRMSGAITVLCLLPLSWNVMQKPSYKRLQLALVSDE